MRHGDGSFRAVRSRDWGFWPNSRITRFACHKSRVQHRAAEFRCNAIEDEVASVRSRTAGVMTTLMRNGRDRRSENPFWAIARLERVVVFGTDQRITSGPAVTVAASRWTQAFTRKQAAYMAAPERFAKRQIPLAPRAPSIHGP